MAIVQNPLINRASGSVGNSTFSKWKNKNTLRSKSISPLPPPSSQQVAHRAQFRNCSMFFSILQPYKSFLFTSYNKKISALNAFVKLNCNLFSADTNIIYMPNINSLRFSSGNIAAPVLYQYSFIANKFVLSLGFKAEYQDIYPPSHLFVCFVNHSTKEFILHVESETNTFVASVILPASFTSNAFSVFAFYSSFEIKASSNSPLLCMVNV